MYKQFLHNFFSRKNNYQTVRDTSLGKVFKYYFFTALVIGVIFSLSAMFVITGKARMGIQQASQQLATIYPDDLVLNFEQTGLSINKDEPFVIPNNINAELPKNLVTFDTSNSFTIQDLKDSESLIVATKDSFFTKKISSQPNIDLGYENYTYKEMGIGIISVTKEFYQTWLKEFTNIVVKALPFLISFGSLFVVLMFFFFNIVISLLFAFVVILVSMLKGWQFSYQDAYKFTLFTTIVALILGSFLSTIGLNIPMMNFLILFILTIVLIPKNKKEPENYDIV